MHYTCKEVKVLLTSVLNIIVTSLKIESFSIFKEKTISNPAFLRQFIVFTNISRYVERAADHTTNIAEDIIFQINGKIVRHDETI